MGEIGLNKNTKNEMTIFEEQVELAVKNDLIMWIHTPHLEDKYKGTRMMVDCLNSRKDVDPMKICFDHCEEHTIRMVIDSGFWASMTIYPMTKNSPSRVIDSVEIFGLERIMADASGDWGPSDPKTLHDTVFEMKRRGHRETDVDTLFYNNPCFFLGQSPKFKHRPLVDRETAWRK